MRLAKSETFLTLVANYPQLKRLVSYSQTPSEMSMLIQDSISWERPLRVFQLTSVSCHLEDPNWPDILNSSTKKNMMILNQAPKMFLWISWLDRPLNSFKRSSITLKMLMKEKKTWENWIIRGELLWSWTSLSLTPPLYSNTALLIHSGKHTETMATSHLNLNTKLSLQHLAPSELVTFPRRDTTKPSVRILLTARIP